MNGREKSDPAIVAGKPANEAAPAAKERVERKAGAEGNASGQSTHRTQGRERRVTGARARTTGRKFASPSPPKVGAVCLNWARTDLCGGAQGNLRPYRDPDGTAAVQRTGGQCQ